MADMVVKRRFLWRMFIKNTEYWLDSLASDGIHIKYLDFSSNYFAFEKGEPKKYRYCFSYNKFYEPEDSQQERALRKNGWEKLFTDDRWSLYRTENLSELTIMPNRRGIYLRNNSMLNVYNLVSFILLLSAFALSVLSLFFYARPVMSEDRFFTRIVTLISVFGGLIVLNFLFFLKLTLDNGKILEEFGAALNPEYAIYRHYLRNMTFENWLEKLLISEGDIVPHFKPFWFLAPDKFENWVELMELKGMNFYRIDKTGTIVYFIKGHSRTIKYYVVGNFKNDLDDTKQLLENEWKIVYSTSGQLGKLVVLARVYERRKPLFFKKKEDYLKNAGKIVKRFLTWIPALFALSAGGFIYQMAAGIGGASLYVAAVVCLISGYLFLRIVRYLVRVRRRSGAIYRQPGGRA